MNTNANTHGTSLPYHTARPKLTASALAELEAQFETLGRGQSLAIAQPGPSSQQKSRIQREHEFFSDIFVRTWNQGRDVSKLYTQYTAPNEREVRKVMDQHAAAFRRLAFPAIADLNTQVLTTQALEQAQKDLVTELQRFSYIEDASSEGEPEYDTDEQNMLSREISNWTVSDLENARKGGLHGKLSALEKVEFELRTKQLAMKSSEEEQKRRAIRFDVNMRKSNQDAIGSRRQVHLSAKDVHPAIDQLRQVDGLLEKLGKPRGIRTTQQHHESRDPVALLGAVNVCLENALQHSRSIGGVLPGTFVSVGDKGDEEEALILLLQRIKLQLARIRARVAVRHEAGEYRGYDEIAVVVEEKFREVRSALLAEE